jgi:hypothetical protein
MSSPPPQADNVPEIETRREREQRLEHWSSVRVASCSPDDLAAARAAGYEPDGDGEWFVGRDPRRMTQDELQAIGLEPMSPLDAIRAKCLDCASTSEEVRKCVAVTCPNWPFRTGKHPWIGPRVLTDEQREAARQRGIALAARKKSGDRA